MNMRILTVSLLTWLSVVGAVAAQTTPVTEALPEPSSAAATPPRSALEAESTGQTAEPAPTMATNTLLIERISEENKAGMPGRGMTMSQVEAKYGAPGEKLEPQGGQKRQWPTIHRWTYPNFVVYFEKSKVIDAVAVKADATEVGPKPPIR